MEATIRLEAIAIRVEAIGISNSRDDVSFFELVHFASHSTKQREGFRVAFTLHSLLWYLHGQDEPSTVAVHVAGQFKPVAHATPPANATVRTNSLHGCILDEGICYPR